MSAVSSGMAQAAGAMAPAILSAVGASNPGVAAIIQLAPVAIQFLQSALQLQQAGIISAEQLAQMFSSVGAGIQNTHDQWAAMNAAEAK